MAKVLGVGGVFFKSKDPEKLAAWYDKWLGIKGAFPHGAMFEPATVPAGGMTVWTPFAASTKYFLPSEKDFMFNLMVDDLDGALKQVKEGGAELVGEAEDSDYGRFGRFIDPEGNKIELWQLPAE